MKGSIRRLLGGRRKFFVGVASAVAALALCVVPTASAHAATTADQATVGATHVDGLTATSAQPAAVHPMDYTACPSTYLCFWVNATWGGAMGKVAGSNAWWGNFSQSQCQTGNWNDCASSIYNHGSTDQALVYENINYNENAAGGTVCIPRGTTEFSNLANWTYTADGHSMNDSISSNSWTATC